MGLNGACTPGLPSETQLSTGNGKLRSCQQRFRSVRFVRYGVPDLATASESLLFGSVEIQINASRQLRYAQMASKQVSRNLVGHE
jgi:hypothetical protein